MFVKDVRREIALTLFVISLLSIWRFFSLPIIISFLSTLLTAQLVENIFNYLYKKKFFLSYSAIVTSLLIFLIVDKNSPAWVLISAVVVGVSSKFILKIGQKHVFNPAALGILVISLLFKTSPSWWGSSWSLLPVLIIYLGSLPVLKRLRRLYIIGGFMIIYFLFTFLSTRNIQSLKFLIDGTVVLFAMVMLPEPQTSPVAGHFLKTFGVFVGILMIILVKLLSSLNLDFLISALLIGDLLSFAYLQKINR